MEGKGKGKDMERKGKARNGREGTEGLEWTGQARVVLFSQQEREMEERCLYPG